MPHVVVIYNPIAGGSRGDDVSARVAARLEQAGHEVERIGTRDRRGAVPIAAEAAERSDWMVAVGGDGTLRELVEGLGAARERVPVGVVPMGNANIVANDLGIPRKVEGAIDVLLEGEPAPMDLGRWATEEDEGLFLGVVGVGWDADAVHLLDEIRHTGMGRRAYRLWADGLYAVTGVAAALRPRQTRLTIRSDGRPLSDRAYCAAFLCNLRTYAKSLSVTPDARRDSGLIHLQARKSALVPALAVQLGAALAGVRSPRSISDYADAARFEVRAEKPFPVQVDGDERGRSTWLTVGVEPGALRMLIPKPGSTRGSARPTPRSPGA